MVKHINKHEICFVLYLQVGKFSVVQFLEVDYQLPLVNVAHSFTINCVKNFLNGKVYIDGTFICKLRNSILVVSTLSSSL